MGSGDQILTGHGPSFLAWRSDVAPIGFAAPIQALIPDHDCRLPVSP
jgi:hypothetical protein